MCCTSVGSSFKNVSALFPIGHTTLKQRHFIISWGRGGGAGWGGGGGTGGEGGGQNSSNEFIISQIFFLSSCVLCLLCILYSTSPLRKHAYSNTLKILQ